MDFDSILKSSLKVVNDGYQTSLSDLKDVVSDLNAAVVRNAGKQFSVVVGEVANDIKGGTFRVYFDTNVNNSRARVIDVVFLRIPAGGYPIAIGVFDKSTQRFFSEQDIVDKEGLLYAFAQLIENPDSALIQAIGYALRTSDSDYEETPF
ncbi:hypothetical protein ABIE30_002974 [Janthinobacterium lividum]|uniref:hypothetical protein n=1 Tax=Janthinobacterium lividum TaxID=29581 RepID=UPI003D1E6C88